MIGYQYFRRRDMVWRRHHGALIPLTMPHAIPPVPAREGLSLTVRHHAPFVRWEEGFDQLESGEWWHVIKDVSEELASLSSNTRSKVRRGLKRFVANPLPREAILSEGYDVYRAAFHRYESFEAMFNYADFRQAVEMLPAETEFWAVRDRDSGKMVAFSENLVRDDACFFDTIWFEPGALKAYAGYVLFHEMNKHYLNDRGLRYISDGARNISHQTNVHEFLEQKFGFRRAYAKLRVMYFPGVGVAVRLLYPFRRWFAGRPAPLFQKIAVLLEQERIRRSCLAVERHK
jgi:hypothetical protein